ncbi:Signal transduction histidine kinase [Thermomonospora echinospora]|uniref:Oxygen sensor histidine kinase NreB n=1 Tax=Thermomonospora echinospora TaxID=1992 RepID=A0A1H5TSG6_9ACTN|nr:ATP-binding protein [Thermomonospora echinospora]SEF64947.1 Signal transduction histidine kinase [Thermomonospora echinospora]
MRFRAACERALDAMDGPIAADAAARRRLLAESELIVCDMVESLRAGRPRVAEPSLATGGRQADPRDSLLFWETFFSIVLRRLITYADIGDRSREPFTLAVLVLYESITSRLSEGLVSYSGHLLDKVHEAQLDERNRITRELHDRVGFWLNTAFRQMELFEVARERGADLSGATERVEKARFAVREAMRSLRATTTGLRLQEPVRHLERALLTAFAALPANEAMVRLNINGDEDWAPDGVKDEVFLIVREAVRNAVVHGRPRLVVVGVHIAPYELRVYVDDDGAGFDVKTLAKGKGIGLSVMRERAEALNGTLTVAGTQGRGTHVELYVPLPEHADPQ